MDKNKPICKYHSYDTFPAKIFFEVRDTKNYNLMRPKPSATVVELEKIFDRVYDERFVILDNPDAKAFLKLNDKQNKLIANKNAIKLILVFWGTLDPILFTSPKIVDIKNEQIASINELLSTPIDINCDMFSEFKRVLDVEIGIIEDELLVISEEIKQIQGEDKKQIFNFYSEIVSLENIHGRTLDEKMMLPKYDQLLILGISKATAQNVKK